MREIQIDNENYPGLLKEISSPPKTLYINGEIKPQDLEKAIAIVGTRNMSKRGEKLAWEFSYELAKNGVTIISGLARGIDTVAHEAALAAGGRTIAVLGSGINLIYPPENKGLVAKIMKNGAIISEFPAVTPPYAKNFLRRNRIVSGLSKAVLIIEGLRRSGTLSTTGWAADQGREVFAIPGSEITDYLIGEGAAIANNPEVILDYLSTLY